ncbi:hypothetical protein JOC78_001721 [Bacillus ectoiniformans]|nr:hypothetical protein [Bacillus ectoiniformans]
MLFAHIVASVSYKLSFCSQTGRIKPQRTKKWTVE